MNSAKKLKRWLPTLVWVALIFIASSIPVIPEKGLNLPHGFDKAIHFIEYLILALLLRRGLFHDSLHIGNLVRGLMIIASIAVAAMDEFYQSYIPGRDSSLLDLLSDVAGITAGFLIASVMQRRSLRKTEKA